MKTAIDDLSDSYLFFDEIQNVAGWEKAVSVFYSEGADVYVTGSNSEMLSSELSTKLSSRCIEIRVQPLSFSEYGLFRVASDKTIRELFDDYLHYGGFPAAALMAEMKPSQIEVMLTGIYATVYTKDVAERNEIRNTALLSNVSRHLMKNIGNRTSVRSCSNYLNSKGMKTTPETVDSYIGMLEQALLFSRAKKMDSKTKEYLRTSDKFYATDLGLRNTLFPYTEADLDELLENVVYNELRLRYGNVSVCDVNGLEVDFVTHSPTTMYWQVSLNIMDEKTREKELRPLRALRDNYPKTVIAYDRFPLKDVDGIRVTEITDWLTKEPNRFAVNSKLFRASLTPESSLSGFFMLMATTNETMKVPRIGVKRIIFVLNPSDISRKQATRYKKK